MNLNDYQKKASETAVYGAGNKIIYPSLGLCGEAGEVAEKVKKVLRDNNGNFTVEKIQELKKELGDVMWYVAALSRDLGLSLEEVCEANLEKLYSRKDRNMIHGNGDDR